MSDPVQSWLDAGQVRRLAEHLLVPAGDPVAAADGAGYDEDFVGFEAAAGALAQSPAEAFELPATRPAPPPAARRENAAASQVRPESPPAPPARESSPPVAAPAPEPETAPAPTPKPEPPAPAPPAEPREPPASTPPAPVAKPEPAPEPEPVPEPKSRPEAKPTPEPTAEAAPPAVSREEAAPAAPEPAVSPAAPVGSLLARVAPMRDWLRERFSASGVFLLDDAGAVVFDESGHGKLHFLARSLATLPRDRPSAIGHVHVKVGPNATLEVIPVETSHGRLVIGAVVPAALEPPQISEIGEALATAASRG